jgi:PAS domain-containing protein
MLQARFSPCNKLISMEMTYDAMGAMQQLERASGSEGTAQIIPGSLETALAPNSREARAITLAKPPYLIVAVNEAWTKLTKYAQMEVEGKELTILDGERTDPDAGNRSGKPLHRFDEIAKGRCACSTNVHYYKEGREFIDFTCSYPLTNANDEVTHILHVYKELPGPSIPSNHGSIYKSESSTPPIQ